MKQLVFAIVALLGYSWGANAALVTVASNGQCTLDTVQITGIQESLGGGSLGSSVSGSYPISATSCLGYVTEPGNTFAENPSPNIGALYDGLLNEEASSGGSPNKDNYYVPGDYFLTHPNDSMVDLDGDGDKTDPGWIRLGGSETYNDGTGVWDFSYDYVNGFDLDNVLDVTVGTQVVDGQLMGYWSLLVDPAAIEAATLALGRPSVFDHLAFVFKGPNPNSGEDDEAVGWSIYDFNFYELIDDGLDVSLGDTAYKFTGDWDASSIFDNPNSTSHFSIWAHDPPATEVPAPMTMVLVLTGLVLLNIRKRKTS